MRKTRLIVISSARDLLLHSLIIELRRSDNKTYTAHILFSRVSAR